MEKERLSPQAAILKPLPNNGSLLGGISNRVAAVSLAVSSLVGCQQPGRWVFPDGYSAVETTSEGGDVTSGSDASSDVSVDAPDSGTDVDAIDVVGDVSTTSDGGDVGQDVSDTSDVDFEVADVVQVPDVEIDTQSVDVGTDATVADVAADVFDATDTVENSKIPWGTVIWDGYGKVTWDPDLQQVVMLPQAATQENETHACLVLSDQVYSQPFQFSFTMKTAKQLRENSPPNPWEVGWVVLGYKNVGPDKGKFKYIIFKPNGLEIGESLLNDVQNDLFTSVQGQTDFPINANYDVAIVVENNIMTVTVNGVEVKKYPMTSADILTPDGLIGVYNEDSEVIVSNFKAQQM